jgi:hypothetical protein
MYRHVKESMCCTPFLRTPPRVVSILDATRQKAQIKGAQKIPCVAADLPQGSAAPVRKVYLRCT